VGKSDKRVGLQKFKEWEVGVSQRTEGEGKSDRDRQSQTSGLDSETLTVSTSKLRKSLFVGIETSEMSSYKWDLKNIIRYYVMSKA
jgi:hypothetical protein